MNKKDRKDLEKKYNRPDPGAIYSCMPTETPEGAYEELWEGPTAAVLGNYERDAVTTLRFADPDGEIHQLPVHVGEHAYNLAKMGTVWRCDVIGDGARVQPELVKVGEWRTSHPFWVRLVESL